ncbi:hypothetical protein [uncultured Ruminococcus sp.]|uniref:hypothetical protein n=1 Tax=uncultured Ruminococcus sp. TaxID=165186 RepID=UPI002615AB2A|nr:hypothetical protein [uncultured Ruminococcus sp.]
MKRNQDSQFARRMQEEYRRNMARCHMLEQQMDEELEKAEPDFDRVDALAREIALLRGLMQESEETEREQKALLSILFRKKRFLRIEWIGVIAAAIFLCIGLSVYPIIQQGRGALEVVEPPQSVQTTETTIPGTTETGVMASGNSKETQTTTVTEIAGVTDSTDASPVETVPEQPVANTDMVSETSSAVSEKQTVPAGGTETSAGRTTHTTHITHTTQTSRTTVSTAVDTTTKAPDEETGNVTTQKTTAPTETTTTFFPDATQTTTTFVPIQTTTQTTMRTTTQTTMRTTTQTTTRTTAQTTTRIMTQTTMQTTTFLTTAVTTTTQQETTPTESQQTAYLFLHSYPDKIEYQPGEEVDFAGANISAGYWYIDENGVRQYQPEVNFQDLTADTVRALIESGALTVDTSQLDMDTPGTYYVVLWYTYGDTTASASFPIFVNASTESTAVSETRTTATVTSAIASNVQKKDSFSEQEGSV